MKKLNYMLIGSLTAACLFLGACSRKEDLPDPIRSVRIMTVRDGRLQSKSQFAGVVQAKVDSLLGFRIPGKIIARQAQLGEHVEAGQILAQIDPQDVKLVLAASDAQLAAATNVLKFAKDNYNRFDSLQKENFISSAELEKYSNQLKVAEAQYQQAKSDADAKKNQLHYTSLFADVAGVVTLVNAQVGQVVAAGTPIVAVAQDGARDGVFSVPENMVKFVKQGATVTLTPWGSDKTIEGKIREVAASADPITRTFVVKAAINPALAPPLGSTLAISMPRLGFSDDAAIKLPSTALIQNGSNTAVWVLNSKTHTVSKKNIVIATAAGNEAVLKTGLTAGDMVVTAGAYELHDGQHVNIYQDARADNDVKIAPISMGAESK